MSRTCVEDGNISCTCGGNYDRCPYKIRKRKMLDEMARGQSPSDKSLYREIYGNSAGASSRSTSSSQTSPASKPSSSDSAGAAALIGLLIVGGIVYGIGKAIHNAFTKTGFNYSVRISNQNSNTVNIELGSYWTCGEFLGWHSNTWKLQAGETKTLSDKTGALKVCHIEKLIVDGSDMSFTKKKIDIKRDTTIEIGNWGARLRD